MQSSERFVRILAALALLLALCGMAEARTRKGDKLLAEGQKAEQRKELDKALDLYEQALVEDPNDAGYQLAARRVRFAASEAHLGLGQKARADGALEQALAEFQKAYAIDPSSMIAEQELKRTLEMMERNKKDAANGSKLSAEEQAMTPVDLARKQIQDSLARMQGPPELRSLSREPISVKMTNQPAKYLFETVAKLAGINAVFDQDFPQDQSKRYSIDLQNSTLEDALDYLSTYTKAYWKPLSQNTIFVTNDNQQKRQELEDIVVKVFYLHNIGTQQELMEFPGILRQVFGAQQNFRVFQYAGLNALVVRATRDQMMIVEKLINDLDKPKPEVVVDVLIMEANRTRSRTLGITPTSGGTPGLNIPILFTPRNPVLLGGDTSGGGTNTGGTTTTPSQQLISLARIAHISTNDFSVTMPGALLQALASDSGTKILQSPQVRAISGGKAVLKIGDQVPIASGGMQPFGGQVGGFSSLYSTFQFKDVGVNVDISPLVNGDHDVTLKMVLEISTVRDHVDIGGISQPIIGQRHVEFEMRLKEGEVNVIGGLMQSQDIKALSGVPGLMNVPILRRIFSSENLQKNESELLFALIPHIVRTPDITPLNLQTVDAGTERIVKVTMAPPEESAAAAVARAEGLAPALAKPAPAEAKAAPAEAKAAPEEAKPEAAMQFLMQPAAAEAQAGGTVAVELRVQNARDLFAAPFHLKFDPQYLQLADVRPGPMFSSDGQTPIFTRNILNETGDATVNLNRTPGATGVSGSGTLATFLFKALKPGTTAVTFSEIGARNSQMQPLGAAIPQAAVTIK
jgi:general secretion pathway protein D